MKEDVRDPTFEWKSGDMVRIYFYTYNDELLCRCDGIIQENGNINVTKGEIPLVQWYKKQINKVVKVHDVEIHLEDKVIKI